MTQPERIALISAGISWRYHDYLKVIELHPDTIHNIRIKTGFSVAFITKCREIAGIKKKKQHEKHLERRDKL